MPMKPGWTPRIKEAIEKGVRGGDACIPWIGHIHKDGYGEVKVNRKARPAHLVVWTIRYGAPPPGMSLDHTCHSVECVGGIRCLHRRCINGDHLEAVSSKENTRRGRTAIVAAERQRAKTHCPSGHAYTPENTYLYPKTGKRACRECWTVRRQARPRRSTQPSSGPRRQES